MALELVAGERDIADSLAAGVLGLDLGRRRVGVADGFEAIDLSAGLALAMWKGEARRRWSRAP
ncbi:MAG: hypothetical protein JO227_21825 [Acetobacteraceae bacterium]|nr:hypothetical protein [Acetobacteraceae bacterium]